jgi:hypothetical protein
MDADRRVGPNDGTEALRELERDRFAGWPLPALSGHVAHSKRSISPARKAATSTTGFGSKPSSTLTPSGWRRRPTAGRRGPWPAAGPALRKASSSPWRTRCSRSTESPTFGSGIGCKATQPTSSTAPTSTTSSSHAFRTPGELCAVRRDLDGDAACCGRRRPAPGAISVVHGRTAEDDSQLERRRARVVGGEDDHRWQAQRPAGTRQPAGRVPSSCPATTSSAGAAAASAGAGGSALRRPEGEGQDASAGAHAAQVEAVHTWPGEARVLPQGEEGQDHQPGTAARCPACTRNARQRPDQPRPQTVAPLW